MSGLSGTFISLFLFSVSSVGEKLKRRDAETLRSIRAGK